MIRPYQEVFNESLVKLKKYQEGNFKPVKTGRPFLDNVFGGLIPGDLVTIAGLSSHGKSYELQRVVNNIFELNNSDNYVCLINSFEMKNLSVLIRDFNTLLKKSKKDILTKEFTEEEKTMLKNYAERFSKGNFFIEEEAHFAEDLIKAWENFLQTHSDKELCIITVDHTALVKSKTDVKKAAVDDMIEGINKLKNKYKNVIFLLLNQMNRGVRSRAAEKNNLSAPNTSDIYNSSTVEQLSDYVYTTTNAYRLGINEYMKVNPEIYEHLEDHFSEKGKRVSFLTYGKMFYHVLKAREESQTFKDLYIEDLEAPKKETVNKKTNSSFSSDSIEKELSLDEIEGDEGTDWLKEF